MAVKVFGLQNCDTCRKARKWLEAEAIAFEFHDLRKSPIDGPTVHGWLSSVGADKLINRRGTTWRGMSEEQKSATGEDLVSLILEHPALMKRPIFVAETHVSVGFDDKVRQALVS